MMMIFQMLQILILSKKMKNKMKFKIHLLKKNKMIFKIQLMLKLM